MYNSPLSLCKLFNMKSLLSPLPLLAVILLLCCSCEIVTAFTVPSRAVVPRERSRAVSNNNIIYNNKIPKKEVVSTTTTTLSMGGGSYNVDGTEEGKYILSFVFFLCVMGFSIPPEFRRARLCTEEQVAASDPSSHCTTFNTWKSELAQYYKDGGGIKFDFSLEKNGDGPEQKYLLRE